MVCCSKYRMKIIIIFGNVKVEYDTNINIITNNEMYYNINKINNNNISTLY